jgi:hypothetical protein
MVKATAPVSSFGLLVQAAFWMVLFGFIISLSSLTLEWPASFYRAMLTMLCHLLNFYFFYTFLIPRYFEKGKHLLVVIGFLAFMIMLTPIRMSIENQFPLNAIPLTTRFGSGSRLGLVIFSEITLAAFASLLRLAVSREQIKQQMSELEKNQLETELRFLKGQMSPHFLFNSINNIYSLVLLKSDQAPEALMKLSELLRYLLYECDHRVALSKEMLALKTYADLFQLKFETPLNLKWDIQINDPHKCVEPLMLVPLLENTIKHSGLGVDATADAKFTVHSDSRKLTVHTDNTLSSVPQPSDSSGIGLGNIRMRLEKLFPGSYTLETRRDGNRFLLTLEIPLL